MKLFTSAQMRAADARAAEAGVSGWRLMETAGTAVAARLLDLFPAVRSVVVLCGKGNNGGDGYVAAMRLAQLGTNVEVMELSSEPSTADAARARAGYVAAGGRLTPLESGALAARLAAADGEVVVLDALLGCGLDRPLGGSMAACVDIVNDSGAPVVAVDVPTGVAADSPVIPGTHMRAHTTVQLAGAKLASAFYPARAAFSRATRPAVDESVVDIGIPPGILDDLSSLTLLTAPDCARMTPKRPPTAHKYSIGTVTIVAGSSAYAGAAELACRGAWRGGAGLVTLVSETRHPSALPETVFRKLAPPGSAGGDPAATAESFPPAGLSRKAAGACVIGPGLADNAGRLLTQVLDWADGPVVIDASALAPDVLWPALERHLSRGGGAGAATELAAQPPRTSLVLTPHAGEAARLLEVGADSVDADPVAAAAELSRRSSAVVVLKGPSTVIASPTGAAAVSTRGHPGMASGGTGDVLAGLVGALAAASPALFDAACLAVFAHGVAGERAASRHGNSLLASDLAEELGSVLADLAAAST